MQKSQKELNSNLLIAIYQNLQTAKQSINNVIDKIKDSKLKRELKRQFNDYDEFSESCEDLAKVFEIELVENNFLKKAKMWLSVNMATMMDKSNRKIASINIVGSVMGVIDLMSVLSDCKKGKKELIRLGQAVLELEERNIEKLKPFLLIDPKKDQKEEVQEELVESDGETPTKVEQGGMWSDQQKQSKKKKKKEKQKITSKSITTKSDNDIKE